MIIITLLVPSNKFSISFISFAGRRKQLELHVFKLKRFSKLRSFMDYLPLAVDYLDWRP